MNQSTWSYQTRLLHMGMALTVSLQLAVSLIMEAPNEENASQLAQTAFEAHELIGMSALVIVIMHWLWSIGSQADGGLGRLFPWFGSDFTEIKADISQLIKGQLPEGGSHAALPSLVHGLGLLAVTGMVITGAILFATFPETGEPSDTVEYFAEIHEIIASLVWMYWGAHIALGLMHKMKGHSTVQDMFNFRR